MKRREPGRRRAERAAPSRAPLWLCALTGGPDRWLTTRPPLTFAEQALATARREAATLFYGAVTGVIVNYSPDRAIRFDLEGKTRCTLTTEPIAPVKSP